MMVSSSAQWFIADNDNPSDMLALAKPIYFILNKYENHKQI